MIKKVEVNSLFQIQPTMFIEIDNEYETVEKITIQGNEATLQVKNKEFVLEQKDLKLYKFAKMEDYSDSIKTEIVYTCKHCSQSVGFDTIEQAKKHEGYCLYNENNKKCVMCKHLKIIEEAPYPKNVKKYVSEDTVHAFGQYRTPICMKDDKVISEEFLWDNHDDCFEVSYEEPVIERSEEYKKWVELSTSDDVENFYNKE